MTGGFRGLCTTKQCLTLVKAEGPPITIRSALQWIRPSYSGVPSLTLQIDAGRRQPRRRLQGPFSRASCGPQMLSYKEMDNLAAVEIDISARVSTEEFDCTAKKLEAFIARHGRVRVLEIIHDFEGMDVKALWHDMKFSLHHLNDFSRCAIVSDAKFLSIWSAIGEPFIDCEVAYFPSDEVEAARDWLLWPEGAADVI